MNTKEFEKQLFVENKEGNLSDLKDLWKNCLQLIKKKVPETVFTFWFNPIVPLKYENNTLTITVPSVIFYNYLEKQCVGLLRETLDNVFGKETNLIYHVPDEHTLLGIVSENISEPPIGKLETTSVECPIRIKENKYTWRDKLKGLVPVYDYDRHRLSTDGKGVTTLVVFHKCLLRCKYCLNSHTWQMDNVFLKMNPEELYDRVKKDNLYFQATGGGITFGGGEPCLYSDFIVKFQKICNPKWKLTIETSLWVQQSHIKKLLPVIDYWIIDIKDMDNNRYKHYTGCDNSLMIKNLKLLLKEGKAKQMLVRVPYIRGFNTKENVENNVRVLKEMGVVNIERFDYTIISDNHLNVKNKNDLLGCLED